MDRQKVRLIVGDLEAALKAVAAKHGCNLDMGGARFTSTMMRLKVELVDSKAPVVTPLSGPVPSVPLGHTFTFRSREYKVVSYQKGRDVTWLIVARQPDGKSFRFHPRDIPNLPAGPAKAKRPDAEIISDLQDAECRLSPENLSCDGELSRTQVASRRNALLARQRALLAELGRQPTAAELFPA